MLHGFRFQPPKWSVLTITLEYNGKASLCLIPDSCFLFMWASLTVSRPDSAPAAPLRSVFCTAPPLCPSWLAVLVYWWRYTGRDERGKTVLPTTREKFFLLSAHSHANKWIETVHRGLEDGFEWLHGQAGHALDAALLINVEDWNATRPWRAYAHTLQEHCAGSKGFRGISRFVLGSGRFEFTQTCVDV